ncbi:hypothetical protein LGH83_15880 [Lichenihabitans sp. PAMC28606]|uniref:hypothetical protein n=1 Tax=Lichenihabitans sp. PAMC28606 TaxID=2880932 RepID=UPI001D0AEA39|nr:hypothetical protein [Lichenihabitans sp. PAMC28606]UDL94014.1 hypothetical protein LGH83_15880 [Lichenihabitans sp. PAMC28606]
MSRVEEGETLGCVESALAQKQRTSAVICGSQQGHEPDKRGSTSARVPLADVAREP